MTEIHLDNSRIHLYSDEWNPRGPDHKEADLAACRARALYCVCMGVGGPMFGEFITGASKPKLVSPTDAMTGNRTPGIFKVASNYGDVVERALLIARMRSR